MFVMIIKNNVLSININEKALWFDYHLYNNKETTFVPTIVINTRWDCNEDIGTEDMFSEKDKPKKK